jgi:AcrR family transcriptional regulator
VSSSVLKQKSKRGRVQRGPGRPRSERAHKAILRSALELLAERGYEGFTMEAIAERAGVGKATVYRRWKGRDEVLTAAVAGFVTENTIPDTGSVEEDLLLLMRGAVRNYQGLPGRIMPGLISAMAQDETLARTFRHGFLEQRRCALREVLERGIRRGELREEVDLELALDFMGGALFTRLLLTGGPVDDDLARGSVDMMLRGMGCLPR